MKFEKFARLNLAIITVCLLAFKPSDLLAQNHKEFAPEGHAPVGVMGDHTHEAGEWMLGYRYLKTNFSDLYQGSSEVDEMAASMAGYGMVATSMDMEMHMLDIMYAPTENITLMLMPMYMNMSMDMSMMPMTMNSNSGMSNSLMMGHGSMMHSHSVSGLGDTNASALINLGRDGNWTLHATVGVNIPTGSVNKKDSEGRYTHYGMQLGSGTWDFTPALTYTAKKNALSWGSQLGAKIPLENQNSSGYRLGEQYMLTAWTAYRIRNWLSISGRIAWNKAGNINGQYDGPQKLSSPSDFVNNYGGEYADLGLGLNLVAQHGSLAGIRLGVEWVKNINSSVNGIQLARDDGLNISLGYAF